MFMDMHFSFFFFFVNIHMDNSCHRQTVVCEISFILFGKYLQNWINQSSYRIDYIFMAISLLQRVWVFHFLLSVE